MLVPLFTSAKRQAMGLVSANRQTFQARCHSQVQWQMPDVVSESQYSENKGREEVRGHVAALMRCEGKYLEEKAARESLEAKMCTQAEYNNTLVIGLEEKLGQADDKLHHIQLDLDSAQDELAKEKAKRKTLEFSHEMLTFKYDALFTTHCTLEADHLTLTQALELSQGREADTAAQLSVSLKETDAIRTRLTATRESRDRAYSELKATYTALAEMRNLHAAAESSASVLQQQVSSLLVCVSTLRVERDELRQALHDARQEAAMARADASAARARLEEERKKTKALEAQLAESSTLLAAARREAADADWTARDEFAKPKMAFTYTVMDVDLFSAEMERDLYKSQYEEESAARESADEARREMAEKLEIALGELERLRAEREEQDRENEDVRHQLGAAADAHTDSLKMMEDRLCEMASEMDGLRARLEGAEPGRTEESLDAKENSAPILAMQRHDATSPVKADNVFKARHQITAFEFASEVTFHSSPVLSSESFWENSKIFELDLREFGDFVPWTNPVMNSSDPGALEMLATGDFSVLPDPSSSSENVSNITFYSPALFRHLIAKENEQFALYACGHSDSDSPVFS